MNCHFVIATVFFKFILFSYHLYKKYKLSYIYIYIYIYIYGELKPALQVLEPNCTSPNLRFSINWYRYQQI